ncbi:MAG TPA: hypothetical protein VIV60_26000, partial [Polyangiaceae bacterium]
AVEVYRRNLMRVVMPIVAIETAAMMVTWGVPSGIGLLVRLVLGIHQPSVFDSSVTFVQYAFGLVLGVIVGGFSSAMIYPYLLDLARGRSVELVDAFSPSPRWRTAIALVAFQSLALLIGSALCALPGAAVVLVNIAAMPLLIDHGLEPLTAVRKSFDYLRAHFVPMLFFGLLSIILTLVGVALCVVGAIIVSVPIVMLGQVYVYLRLQGEVPVGVA